MTEREAFEQWAVTEDFSVARDQWERYASIATQHALAGWQASRKQALEEASKVCDGLTHALDNSGVSYHRAADAARCARAIRSLTSPIGEKA